MPTVEWLIFEVIPRLFHSLWKFIWVSPNEVVYVEPNVVSQPVITYPKSLPAPKRKREPLPYKLRFEILKRDNFTCQYCGRRGQGIVLQVDHIIPKANGGSDKPSNLITACDACNGGKGDVLLVDNSYLNR